MISIVTRNWSASRYLSIVTFYCYSSLVTVDGPKERILSMFDFEKGKVRFIRGGKYPQSNSVLIDDDIRTIIDPACNEEKLLSIHRERPIEVVINSHGHEDHILYNSLFPDAQLWVHKLDADVFRDMDVFINQFFPRMKWMKKPLLPGLNF